MPEIGDQTETVVVAGDTNFAGLEGCRDIGFAGNLFGPFHTDFALVAGTVQTYQPSLLGAEHSERFGGSFAVVVAVNASSDQPFVALQGNRLSVQLRDQQSFAENANYFYFDFITYSQLICVNLLLS